MSIYIYISIGKFICGRSHAKITPYRSTSRFGAEYSISYGSGVAHSVRNPVRRVTECPEHHASFLRRHILYGRAARSETRRPLSSQVAWGGTLPACLLCVAMDCDFHLGSHLPTPEWCEGLANEAAKPPQAAGARRYSMLQRSRRSAAGILCSMAARQAALQVGGHSVRAVIVRAPAGAAERLGNGKPQCSCQGAADIVAGFMNVERSKAIGFVKACKRLLIR